MIRNRLHALAMAALVSVPAVSAAESKVDLRAPAPAVSTGAAKLEVKNVVGLVGQTVTLEAALSRVDGGAPVAGRTVTFRIKGAPGGDVAAGSGSTDGSGRAKVSFKVPEIKQGSYDLAAVSPGETPMAPTATGAAKIGIFKPETKLSLSEGLAPSPGTHGHPPAGALGHQWVQIHLTRKTDGQELQGRKVRVTLDGKPLADQTASGAIRLPDVPNLPPLLATPWTVEVRFDGDDAYQSTAPARLVVKKKP